MKDEWLDRVKDRLDDCHLEPSDALWSSIKRDMPVAPVRRRQRFLYLRYSSVAAAVAIVAVAGWLMWDRSDVVECAPGVAPTVRFVRAGGSSDVSQEMSEANDASRRFGSHVASVSSASVFSRRIADGDDVSVLDV
ncbi:MAG: hypothetical protein SPH89_02925, partial [Candidatus Limisoma sp.]|nr:hypothetical protein [Candidatus Limisoma sp.]